MMVGMTKEELKEYYKNYYKNPENKEKQRLRAREYNKTEKGKKLRADWREAHKEELTKYHKAYGKKARAEAKEKGICGICYKNPSVLNLVSCKECRERSQLNNLKRQGKVINNGDKPTTN